MNKLLESLLPLETNKLIIKKSSPNDVDLLLKMDNQEITQKFLGGIKNKTRDDRIKFLKKKDSFLTICLKDNTPIGFIDLKINKEDNTCELSYIFDFDFTNNGYCTECCKCLLDIVFNKLLLNKIYADFVSDNLSSKRVLDKLGFKFSKSLIKDNILFLKYELSKDDYFG